VSGETGKPLDAPALLEVLERHRVQYIVVGGYAAELRGSVRRTVDVDVVPRTTADNLERLAAALREVQAKIRTEGILEGLPRCRPPPATRLPANSSGTPAITPIPSTPLPPGPALPLPPKPAFWWRWPRRVWLPTRWR